VRNAGRLLFLEKHVVKLAAVLLFTSASVFAQPVFQITAYTRALLLKDNAAAARAYLGTAAETNVTALATTVTNLANTVTNVATSVTNLANTVTNLANTVTNLANTVTNLANTVTNVATSVTDLGTTLTNIAAGKQALSLGLNTLAAIAADGVVIREGGNNFEVKLGTQDRLVRWTGDPAIGDSLIRDNGVNIEIPSPVMLDSSLSFQGVLSPAQIVANQNDYAPTGYATNTIWRLNSDASRDITGIIGSTSGRIIILVNVGGFNIRLRSLSGSSATTNQFRINYDLNLLPDQGVAIQYDLTSAKWRLWNLKGLIKDDGLNVGIGTGASADARLYIVGQSGTDQNATILKAYAVAGSGIWFAYDTTGNIGYLGAIQEGVAHQPLKINSLGGTVFLGSSSSLVNVPGTLTLGTDAAAPTAVKARGPAGVGTDKSGGDVTIVGGIGTGTGRGGALIGTTSLSTTTGSTAQSESVRYYYSSKFKDLVESSATTIANVAIGSGKFIAAQFWCTVHADNGTDFQAFSARVAFNAVNKAGTVTVGTITQTDTLIATSSGTLTCTYTAVANGASVDLKANAASSLTQTTLRAKWAITAINSDDPVTVTPQ